ncbi:hypothetical protein A0H81_13466 [Grifola frondosa]|uniref:Uncharacterized protein n=1 Tax=Grifola frondosa TaxID=5627 RepID=A0A1C7LR78_GRIFR|nr:hypothetical protein A0H81_13466 [Grifola frondosa]
MPQQVEHASPVKLSSITTDLVSRKLRIAGRLLAYDFDTTILLLHDGDNGLLVDVSLCLNPYKSMRWLRESNAIVMVFGYLEQSSSPLPVPALPYHSRATKVNHYLVLRAMLAQEAPDLDLVLWNRCLEEGIA